MSRIRFLSKVEQVAAYLRDEVASGKWQREIPGREELAQDIGVNPKTVERALHLLEKDGILESQGPGRKRRICGGQHERSSLKITIMLYERSDFIQQYHDDLINRLSNAGYIATIAEKSLIEMNMDVKKVGKFIKSIETDAWIVCAAPRDILECFVELGIPTFAEFGRSTQLDIAAARIDKTPAVKGALDKLISMGHQRIVMLTRPERCLPNPGYAERVYLQHLEDNGISTGSYNLPYWSNDIKGYQQCLESLFGKTPPTAIFITEAPHFLSAQLFLSRRGILVPKDVSLICLDPDPAFTWCSPQVSHISYDIQPVSNCIFKWANRIAAGKEDRKQTLIQAEFIEGGTIGPA